MAGTPCFKPKKRNPPSRLHANHLEALFSLYSLNTGCFCHFKHRSRGPKRTDKQTNIRTHTFFGKHFRKPEREWLHARAKKVTKCRSTAMMVINNSTNKNSCEFWLHLCKFKCIAAIKIFPLIYYHSHFLVCIWPDLFNSLVVLCIYHLFV